MGIFSRKGSARPAPTDQQPPDRFADEAALKYGVADFAEAASLYAEAIDKLHTMYVIGGCKYRSPSSDDQRILDGIVSSVGAAKAMGEEASSSDIVRSASYLEQIAALPATASFQHEYTNAIGELRRAL